MIIGNLLKQTSNILYSLMKSTLLAHIDSYMYESGSNLHLQYFCVSLWFQFFICKHAMEKGEYDTKRKPVESKSSKTELQGSTQTASEASSSRPHKLQKLDELKRKHPFVTQSALSSLVSEFKKEGLPQLSSRKHQSEAKKLASSGEAYGPLIRKVSLSCCDGESISLEVVNYLTFLALAFQSGGALYEGLCKAFAAGCSYDQPFKLLLYSDEIVPGNPLGYTLSRKVWVFYASIVELGGSNLQKEIAWQCLCICRSSLVSKLQAGVSQFLQQY